MCNRAGELNGGQGIHEEYLGKQSIHMTVGWSTGVKIHYAA